MADLDNRDYIAAIVIGTLLGVGAAMVFRKKPTVRSVLARDLKPYGKAMRKTANRAGRDALEQGEELLEASREILDAFRDEVSKVVGDARDELSDTMRAQVKDARRAVRRAAKRF
jgi:gas vesicle protein